MDKKMMTVDEVAEFLAVSPSSVRRYVDRGELPVVRFGGSVRFDSDDVERLVERCKAKASTEGA